MECLTCHDRWLSHPPCRTRAMGNKGGSDTGFSETGRSGDLGRSLHLVDIENLVGEPTSWSPERIKATFDAYLLTATCRPGDSKGWKFIGG